jgi:hypothetical protein
MSVYLISYIFLLILNLKDITIKKSSYLIEKYLLVFFLAIASVLAGIRFGVGRDFFNYMRIFRGIETASDYEHLEFGFRFLVSIFKAVGFSEQWLFFIFAFIAFAFLVKGILSLSKRPLLSVFIYWCVFYIGYVFNGLRQGIAMSIFIFLLKDIEQRNFRKILLFSVLAAAIHFSGIFIIVAYFAYNIKLSRKTYLALTFLMFLVLITNNYWMNTLISTLPSFLSSKVVRYQTRFETGLTLFNVLQRIALLSIFLTYYNDIVKKFKEFKGFFSIYYCGFIFYSIFSFQAMFATRINMFFRILEIVLIPYLIELKINRHQKLIILISIIIWSTLIYLSEFNNPSNYPFRTIFK